MTEPTEPTEPAGPAPIDRPHRRTIRSYARDRIDGLEDRIERLDSEPTENAEDISKVWGMVLGLLEDAAECYEEGPQDD